jgi:hypothetical protein
LGRLGVDVSNDLSDFPVLRDLLEWTANVPSEALLMLCDGKHYNWNLLLQRKNAKPRITIWAELTSHGNLSVRWCPTGYQDGVINLQKLQNHHYNSVEGMDNPQPLDFCYFSDQPKPTFNARPQNELMFIRGVADLVPDPDLQGYGINRDTIDAVLICAVRSCFENLTKNLTRSFEVKVQTEFKFDTREEMSHENPARSIARVVRWELRPIDTIR